MAEVKIMKMKVMRGAVKEGQCPVCAAFHEPGEPHNLRSLYYHATFFEDNGRYPTWKDALEHCSAVAKERWLMALGELGLEVD